MPASAVMKTRDGHFSYEAAGDPASVPLVFLHGIGGAARGPTGAGQTTKLCSQSSARRGCRRARNLQAIGEPDRLRGDRFVIGPCPPGLSSFNLTRVRRLPVPAVVLLHPIERHALSEPRLLHPCNRFKSGLRKMRGIRLVRDRCNRRRLRQSCRRVRKTNCSRTQHR